MSGKSIISGVDAGNTVFQKSFSKLGSQQIKEAKKALGELVMMDVGHAPAKLHFHCLKDKEVVSVLDPKKKVKVYTIHLTSDDKIKASFTIENGTAYLRVCGEHDTVDKSP